MSKQATGGYPAILVLDPVGDVFRRVRVLGLEASVWRVAGLDRSDVAAADLVLYVPSGDPDWSTAALLAARVPTIAVLPSCHTGRAVEALRRGLWGCIEARLSCAALRRTLIGALAGEPAFARAVLGAWLGARSLHVGDQRLTDRQREIIGLIAEGATDKKIAAVLGISVATAEKHVGNILDRLRVPSRAAAVAAATASPLFLDSLPSAEAPVIGTADR